MGDENEKRVVTTHETESGRNTQFKDTKTGHTMTRAEFVKKIENGTYEDYHVRVIDKVKTPCSNPDKSENNNLG